MIIKKARSDWKRVPIREAYSGLYDGPHATPKPSDKGPIFLGIGNISEDGRLNLNDVRHIAEEDFSKWTKRVEPQANDIVFTYEATLNRYAIIPYGFRGCLGRRLALIRPNLDVIDHRFLFYYFFGAEWRKTITLNTLTGATVDRIPIARFPEFPIDLPSLPVQHRIAGILSVYDDLIENNTRRIQILEQMAQTIYREWFVHFRFPGHEKVKVVESPLGKIPQGWAVRQVGDVASLFRGKSYRSSDLADGGGLPFINLKCIERGGGFRADGIKSFVGDYKESNICRTGDIVIGITDMTQERRIIAHAARIPRLRSEFGVMSMDLVRVSPSGSLPKHFLYGLLRFSDFSASVSQHANGVNVLHLSPSQIEAFKFAFPSINLAKLYAEISESLYGLIDVLEAKNINLRRTRDLLLPKLISGELDVSELDIETAENVG